MGERFVHLYARRMIMKEIWKDIPGYRGFYQASTFGRIRSVDRNITQIGRGGKPFTRLIKGRILKPGRYNKRGHLSVVLGRGTNGIQVHYLVAVTFLGSRPNNDDIRHIDGDPQNNRVDNLAYGTRTDNILDVYRQSKKWRTTSVKQAIKIKKLLSNSNLHCTDIAKSVGVSPHVVYAIKRNRTFWWLSEEGEING